MKYSDEIKKKLGEEYKYRIELHAHTKPASPCSEIPPTELINTFHNAGYDGIAVTNHFFPYLFENLSKQDYLDFYKRDFDAAFNEGEKLGMKVYLGAELRFESENDNDYLFYGWSFDMLGDIYEYLKGGLAEFSKAFRSENTFLLQAHPFRNGMERADTSLLDGVEAFNLHPNHNSRVAVAANYARDNGKIMTVGTDFHHPGHFNLSATRARALPNNTSELVKLLHEEDFIIEIGGRLAV